MSGFLVAFNAGVKEGARLYFAPLVGAVQAVRAELAKQEQPRTKRKAEPEPPPQKKR